MNNCYDSCIMKIGGVSMDLVILIFIIPILLRKVDIRIVLTLGAK